MAEGSMSRSTALSKEHFISVLFVTPFCISIFVYRFLFAAQTGMIRNKDAMLQPDGKKEWFPYQNSHGLKFQTMADSRQA